MAGWREQGKQRCGECGEALVVASTPIGPNQIEQFNRCPRCDQAGNADVDWAAFPGPHDYVPRQVERAFAELEQIQDPLYSSHVSNRVLSAVGNNHAGAAYPAAVAAVPKLARLALTQPGLVRATALEILVSLLQFAPEPGFESVRRADGSLAQLAEELHLSVAPLVGAFLELVANPNETERVRLQALRIVCQIAEPPVLRRAVGALLTTELPRRLEQELQDVLEEPEGLGP